MGQDDTKGTSARSADPRVTDSARLGRLAEEQAALRRVAMLVASGASSAEVFAAVAHEVAQVMGLPLVGIFRSDDGGTAMTVIAVWGERQHKLQPGTRWPIDGPSMVARVLETGRPARVEDYTDLSGSLSAAARESALEKTAGAPIIVDGTVWGVLATSSLGAPLPDDLEDRLEAFTTLLATVIANSQAHDELARLAEEQAGLRRVATLVAQGAPSAEVFAAVAKDVAEVLHLANTAVCRYEDGGTAMTVLAAFGQRPDVFYPGSRWPLDGPSLSAEILRTGRPGRRDEYVHVPGSRAAAAREHGFDRVAGAPIILDGHVWGVILTSSTEAAFPAGLEDRLAEFTELVATAIANTQAREELARLAEEQVALRRVATLVAQTPPAADVFRAVTAEVAQLVQADASALTRYESDGTVTALGGWTAAGEYEHVGTRFDMEGTVSGLVFDTSRPGRISLDDSPGTAAAAARDMGWRSVVGAPITVDGHLWGVLAVVSTTDGELPLDTEQRLAQFTELVATAIANTESREELTRLADEQAALRRVATLVARDAPPAEVLDAVVTEVGRLFGADLALLHRYDPDDAITLLAVHGANVPRNPVGTRWPLDPHSLVTDVKRTGRSARNESYEGTPGPSAERSREQGFRSSVAAPINVEGRLWGVAVAMWKQEGNWAAHAETRIAAFTDLVATAIANAESRAELDASRARIVATADATRRRIERDLHDGAQQQLVSLALELRAAQAAVPPELAQHRAELSHVVEGLTSVLEGLREIALGIHPAGLAEGGLEPALKTLARRSPIPVELDVRAGARLPERVEVAAYYVVSEALTNASKYAQATAVRVDIEILDSLVRVAVRDNGVGGADPARGSGLLGLKDRAEAIGGRISLQSRHGAGTSLVVELPLA